MSPVVLDVLLWCMYAVPLVLMLLFLLWCADADGLGVLDAYYRPRIERTLERMRREGRDDETILGTLYFEYAWTRVPRILEAVARSDSELAAHAGRLVDLARNRRRADAR